MPLKPLGDRVAGIDAGVNNLLAVYVEDGSALLVSGRPLKSASFYWRNRIAQYQSTIGGYGLRTSRKLRRMFKKWRRRVADYINWAVGNTVEWLYRRGVSTIAVGYPRYIAQNSGKNSKVNFEITHAWTYGYLLRRIREVGEEYGITVELAREESTSTTCPLCRTKDNNHRGLFRGLLKCYTHNEMFNADLVGAFSIASKVKPIAPSPALHGVRVTRLRPSVGLNPTEGGGVVPNLPAGTLAPSGRRGGRRMRWSM